MRSSHTGNTTVPTPEDDPAAAPEDDASYPSLVILWSKAEPRRVGEAGVLTVRGHPYLFGRDDRADGGGLPRLKMGKYRPASFEYGGPLAGNALSRDQLRIQARAFGIEMEVLGQCPTFVNGRRIERERKFNVVPGDVVYLQGQLLLLCKRRPGRFSPPKHFPEAFYGPFGEPDRIGLVGESVTAWALRDAIAAAAKLPGHVLILGPSGSGKALVARGIHLLSKRASGPFVSVNCAAIPRGLLEAELFGHARNYPNTGMPERQGHFGAADGGTLFLDEIGEMSLEAQAALLQVLDSGGQYHRLGESGARHTDVLVVTATNRQASELKHDLAARLEVVIDVPALEKRREDIPMLVRHLLLGAEAKDGAIAGRFLEADEDGWRHPKLGGDVMQELVRGEYEKNVRALNRELLRVLKNDGKWTPPPREKPTATDGQGDDQAPSADELLAALEGERGNVKRTAERLGVTRQQLYRALEKHGLKDDE